MCVNVGFSYVTAAVLNHKKPICGETMSVCENEEENYTQKVVCGAVKNVAHMSKEILGNLVVIAGVYAVQLLFHQDFFRCPCTHHKIYGVAFLVAPAIALLGVSLVVCKRSWSVVVVCWKHRNKTARCNYFLDYLVDFFRPFFASSVWLILALFRGEYYVCIRGGPSPKMCGSSEEKGSVLAHTILVDMDTLYAQSFVIGAACLIALLIFVTGIVCIQRLCTNNVECLPTIDDFHQMKSAAIIEAFEEKSRALANEFAANLVETSFHVQEADVEIDERFYLARERLHRDHERRRQNECVINCPENDEFTSMEFTPM